jgi:hypothetical protein
METHESVVGADVMDSGIAGMQMDSKSVVGTGVSNAGCVRAEESFVDADSGMHKSVLEAGVSIVDAVFMDAIENLP